MEKKVKKTVVKKIDAVRNQVAVKKPVPVKRSVANKKTVSEKLVTATKNNTNQTDVAEKRVVRNLAASKKTAIVKKPIKTAIVVKKSSVVKKSTPVKKPVAVKKPIVVKKTALVKKSGVAKKSVVAKAATAPKVSLKKRPDLRAEILGEVNAAFNLCLTAVEQAANLMESRLTTVLGEVSNLLSGANPTFSAGKLKSVVSADGSERTEYIHAKDGSVTSRTYRANVLKFEILHDEFGVPRSGKMFGENGRCVREFNYGPNGQVMNVKG